MVSGLVWREDFQDLTSSKQHTLLVKNVWIHCERIKKKNF